MIPKISVILSVYNGEKYIKEAMQSILDQTFGDFEFIIIDDGSVDKTSQVLDGFQDPRIVRLKNEKNIGLVKSLNRGLEMARGEFIARMDADDITYPQRFEKQIRFLEQNPSVGVLGTAIEYINTKGKRISVSREPASHELIFWKMFFDCAIIHPTVMMRREVVTSVHGYDPTFIHIEDTELWSRLVNLTRFANLSEVLHARRLHRQSIMSTQSAIQYRSGIIIRRRLFEGVLSRKIPNYVAEHFSSPEKLLNQDQIKEIVSILKELYAQFIQNKTLQIDFAIESILREDLKRRIAIVSRSGRNALARRVFGWVKKFIPAPLRYQLKVFAKKYFGRYLRNL